MTMKKMFVTLKPGTSSTTNITITTHQVPICRHDIHQNGILQNETQHKNKKMRHLA
jgi:hypothetical protein